MSTDRAPQPAPLGQASPGAASDSPQRADEGLGREQSAAGELLIDTDVPPSGSGCVECLASGGWWFHLRRCVGCGHIGCCDSSPSRHASHHAADTGHAVVQSYEPGEDWSWDYASGRYAVGMALAPPHHHPLDQPVPGPAGRVPPDWKRQLR